MTTLVRAMIDTGRRLRVEQSGPWIEGQRPTAETTGSPFPCLLTVTAASESDDGSDVFRARLIYRPLVELDADDRVVIDSSALGEATWQVDGPPTVIRRGRRLVAHEVNLVRIEGT